MRVDISGVVQGSPTLKGKSASLKLYGGGPYMYAYGNFGEQIVAKVSDGTAILASGSVNYAKDGDGQWEKYINLTGSISILPNKQKKENEDSKITFVTTGVLLDVTPQQIKSGTMAKFTIEETTVDFRGDFSAKHSVVAFEDVATSVLALKAGQAVMVAGNVQRVRGKGDDWYTSFVASHVVSIEVTAYTPPQTPTSQGGFEAQAPATIDEDDLPF